MSAAPSKKIAEAKQLLGEIAEATDPKHWELARLVHELLSGGFNKRKLAQELDVTTEYLRQLRKTLRSFNETNSTIRITEAVSEVRGELVYHAQSPSLRSAPSRCPASLRPRCGSMSPAVRSKPRARSPSYS